MDVHADLIAIARQEEVLRYSSFSEQHAWQLGQLLYEGGCSGAHPIAIDISRLDRQLFYAALPGTSPDNQDWIRRKRNVVTRFGRSSYFMGQTMKAADSTLVARYGLKLADYAAAGGAFPIMVRDVGIVGCVTISGLAAREDHNLVVAALCEALGVRYADLALDTESAKAR
jgi:uncharacterized protein (UPF0303 family)